MRRRRALPALALAVLAAGALVAWRCTARPAVHTVVAPAPAGSAKARRGAVPGTASIAGTVTDPQHAPVAGIRVCGIGKDEPQCGTSDARGAYRIEQLAAGEYAMVATGKPYLPARAPTAVHVATGERRDGIDFVMQPGGVEIHGTVSDVGGGPVAHATVTSCNEPGGPATETDDHGAYSLWVAPTSSAIVCAQATAYQVGIATGAAPGTIDIRLAPDGTLVGIVIDGATNQPVAGAHVVGVTQESQHETRAIADDSGTFQLSKLSPGRIHVTATAPHRRGSSAGSIRVGPGEAATGVVVRVWPANRVTGRVVVAATGAPCPKAYVTFAQVDKAGFRLEPADGDTYVADGVAPGTYYVAAGCPGFAESYAKLVVGEGDASATWSVEPGFAIRGRVTRAGVPLAGVTVQVGSNYVRTDADGRYEVRPFGPGSYWVVVGIWPHDVSARVTVEHADATVDLDLPAIGSLDGEIVDQTGVAVRARVSARGHSWNDGSSDAAGHFHFDEIDVGDYCLVVTDARYQELRGRSPDPECAARVHIDAGETAHAHVVVTSFSGRITGAVRDVAGAPVTDAFIRAYPEAGGDTKYVSDDGEPVAADGSFAIEHLAPGTYTLRAYRADGTEGRVAHVAVGADVTVRIGGTARLAGHVTGANEVQIALANTATFAQRKETFEHTDGQYEVTELPAGTYMVEATGDDGEAIASVTIAEGEAKTLDFTLAPAPRIVGRIVGATTHAPIEDAYVAIDYPGAIKRYSVEGHSDDNGRFTLGPLARDVVTLRISAPHVQTNRTIDTTGTTGTLDLGDIVVTDTGP